MKEERILMPKVKELASGEGSGKHNRRRRHTGELHRNLRCSFPILQPALRDGSGLAQDGKSATLILPAVQQ